MTRGLYSTFEKFSKSTQIRKMPSNNFFTFLYSHIPIHFNLHILFLFKERISMKFDKFYDSSSILCDFTLFIYLKILCSDALTIK